MIKCVKQRQTWYGQIYSLYQLGMNSMHEISVVGKSLNEANYKRPQILTRNHGAKKSQKRIISIAANVTPIGSNIRHLII